MPIQSPARRFIDENFSVFWWKRANWWWWSRFPINASLSPHWWWFAYLLYFRRRWMGAPHLRLFIFTIINDHFQWPYLLHKPVSHHVANSLTPLIYLYKMPMMPAYYSEEAYEAWNTLVRDGRRANAAPVLKKRQPLITSESMTEKLTR